MEYKGKVYARVAGKYIECTKSVEDLETEIKTLKKIVIDSHNIMKTFDEQRAYEFLTNKIEDLKIKL